MFLKGLHESTKDFRIVCNNFIQSFCEGFQGVFKSFREVHEFLRYEVLYGKGISKKYKTSHSASLR